MARPRNVLFILADQFRSDCTGFSGNSVIQTPNLDYLASQGCSFTKAFVQASPCGPSRACIYTSRYLCSTRVVDNFTPLIGAEDNLAMKLREAGHDPAISGYNDYALDPRDLPDDDPRRSRLDYGNFLPGFSVRLAHEYDSPQYFEMLRKKGYSADLCRHETIHSPNVPAEGPGHHLPCHFPAYYKAEDSESQFLTSDAIEYMRERRGKGWILSLNYIKPHPPLVCPEPYHAMYESERMPKANRESMELKRDHPYVEIMHTEPKLLDELHLREYKAAYYGMISELDACIGRIIETLKESGEWDNTLIIFTSDHGEYLGDHYLTDKGHFYDETMRVPYILRDPSPEANVTRSKHINTYVESIDSAPTILEFLGVPVPESFMGKSLLETIRNPGRQHRREIHFEFDYRNRVDDPDADLDKCLLWVVRDDCYKYVQFADESIPPLLFDMKKDPTEQNDVADLPQNAVLVAAYCQRLLRWRMTYEDQRMEHWATQYR